MATATRKAKATTTTKVANKTKAKAKTKAKPVKQQDMFLYISKNDRYEDSGNLPFMRGFLSIPADLIDNIEAMCFYDEERDSYQLDVSLWKKGGGVLSGSVKESWKVSKGNVDEDDLDLDDDGDEEEDDDEEEDEEDELEEDDDDDEDDEPQPAQRSAKRSSRAVPSNGARKRR